MKFGPSHFPVGTVFRVGKHLLSSLDDTVDYTVVRVHKNGPRSYVLYVLETDSPETSLPTFRQFMCFNIAHVACIVRRGPGEAQVVFDHKSVKRTAEDVQMMSLDHSDMFPRKPGVYRTGSLRALIQYKLDRIIPRGQTIDLSRLIKDVRHQGWCGETPDRLFVFWTVKRKKLDRFLKANWMRYRKSLRAWEKELDEEIEKEMEEAMEDISKDLEDDWYDGWQDSMEYNHVQPI